MVLPEVLNPRRDDSGVSAPDARDGLTDCAHGCRPARGALFWAGAMLALVYVGRHLRGLLRTGEQRRWRTWWPAAGIAVRCSCSAPGRWWPTLAVGIVVSSGLANLTAGRTVELSVLFGIAEHRRGLRDRRVPPAAPRRAPADGLPRRLLPARGRLRARGRDRRPRHRGVRRRSPGAMPSRRPDRDALAPRLDPGHRPARRWSGASRRPCATAPSWSLQSLLLAGVTLAVFWPEQEPGAGVPAAAAADLGRLRFGTSVVSGQLLRGRCDDHVPHRSRWRAVRDRRPGDRRRRGRPARSCRPTSCAPP